MVEEDRRTESFDLQMGTHWVAVGWCHEQSFTALSESPNGSSKICALVERPDRHCSDDLVRLLRRQLLPMRLFFYTLELFHECCELISIPESRSIFCYLTNCRRDPEIGAHIPSCMRHINGRFHFSRKLRKLATLQIYTKVDLGRWFHRGLIWRHQLLSSAANRVNAAAFAETNWFFLPWKYFKIRKPLTLDSVYISVKNDVTSYFRCDACLVNMSVFGPG